MSGLVPGIVVLIGKIGFLLALYGFLFAVYRGLLEEARRGPRAAAGPPQASASVVDRWELRPASVGATVLRPTATAQPATAGTVSPPPGAVSAAPQGPLSPAAAGPMPVVLTPPSGPVAATPPPTTVLPVPPPQPAAEPQPPPEPAALVVLTSPEASLTNGERLQLGDAVSLGRADDSTIVLKDRFVSAQHAQVVRRGHLHVLRDLGSTNGTFCNGARIERETVLREGDRIGIGTSVFAFREGH